jgi:amino acid transporter
VIPLLNVTATVQAVAFALVSIGVLIRRRSEATTAGWRAPGGLVTPILATVGSVIAFALAIYQPYAATGKVPLEWMLIGGWALLGGILWARSSRTRRAVSPAERRRLMLGS